jgi:hypothetical protein
MDIRLPIGLMFALTGLIITVWGIVSDPEIYRKSLGININLWTGSAMLVFGLTFLFFGLAAQSRNRKQMHRIPQ